jgi:dolichyl-phosphate beta-glucosyltransferase
MDLSIVIPAYNEEQRILSTIKEIQEHFASQQRSIEVLVVNDGSVDRTAEIVTEFAKDFPVLRLLSLVKNSGKGAAVRAGMLEAQGAVVLFTDADGSTPISEFDRLERVLKSKAADLVIGSRAVQNSDTKIEAKVVRKLIGRIFNLCVNLLAVPEIKDTQCGFKLFTNASAKILFNKQKFPRFSFDLEILWRARKLGMRIEEVGINWHHVAGSKVNVFKDGLKMLRDAFILACSKPD